MLFEKLDDVKEQNPLILDSNYKAMDILVLEDVERGEPVYINTNKEGTKTATGNKLFGIVLDDMQANGIAAICRLTVYLYFLTNSLHSFYRLKIVLLHLLFKTFFLIYFHLLLYMLMEI